MRIALVTPGFSHSEQDWCIPALWDLVRGLSAQHEVLVVTLRYPHTPSSYRVHGATVVALGGAGVRGWRRLPFLLQARRRLEDEVAAFGCDLLHALWAHEPGYLAVRVAARRRLPCLVSLLGGELTALADINYGGQLTALNRHLVGSALGRATLVSSGSAFFDAIASEHVSAPRRRILPLGVDGERFNPVGEVGTLSGRPSILRVAALSPVKDPLTALEALSKLHRFPEAHLHFVGDGELRGSVEERIDGLGLRSRVVLHGDLRHELLPPLYRAADLCISSSRFESQAMVLLEAGACGKLTVGTAVGLLPELVEPELLCCVGDAEGLAAAIERGLQGSEIRGPEWIREHFALERTVESWIATYRELSP